MNHSNLKLSLPPELAQEMEVQATVVSPTHPDVGVLVLSKGMNHFSNEITIRIYRLQRDSTNGRYSIVIELEAFMFKSYRKAKEFINHLPNMTATEMLLLLNPVSNSPQLQ
ncbi:hypothetical protein [Sutcliffiella horikoshii]|uniref:hypothetical protein n=1 Tax=Sutcliffiella horikoshii TaxID=79883 RepID=UPI001CFDD165|nr:hypothetical protein [Sutcliffiella horikoshii]